MTLFGPDGAAWQEGIKLTQADWDAVDFVIWRVIHEDGRKDRTFEPMRAECEARNKPFAAYVWLNATPQATKALQTRAALGDPSIPVMVDWEDHSCPPGEMREFISEARKLSLWVPLLYTGQGFWSSMGSPRLDDLDVELVVARYGNQAPTGTYEIESRYLEMEARYPTWDWNLGGLKPSMWQYGSRVRWGDRYMDMNAVRDPMCIERCFKHWQQEEEDEMVTTEDIALIVEAVWSRKMVDPATGVTVTATDLLMWARGSAAQAAHHKVPLPAGEIDRIAVAVATKVQGTNVTAADIARALVAELS